MESLTMLNTLTRLKEIDWNNINNQLDAQGYALLSGMLDASNYHELTAADHRVETLEQRDSGCGTLHCYSSGLPSSLAAWRESLYRYLVPTANRWNEVLDVGFRYPGEWETFRKINQDAGQVHELTHLNLLNAGDYACLTQQNEGEYLFPLQIVAVLPEPDNEFTGGEFVMTEQRPRMQSRPLVVPLRPGDMAIIATAERPFRGTKGYYRVTSRHAISRVRSGLRVGLEMSFHCKA
jgi:hypothetical protein